VIKTHSCPGISLSLSGMIFNLNNSCRIKFLFDFSFPAMVISLSLFWPGKRLTFASEAIIPLNMYKNGKVVANVKFKTQKLRDT